MAFNRAKKQPLRGVNLGGWLVLEPWITPSLFTGTDAEDECSFCDTANTARTRKLRNHRRTFVTEQDFVWLAKHDVEAVRIPVGYWIFGDMPPYIGGLEYLDVAFAWAEKHGIRILLDVHGAPGSQNGEMHSGCKGSIGWADDAVHEYVAASLKFVERLAKRYANREVLLGVEMLNEPSGLIPKQILAKYYKSAYRIIRRELGADAWVVLSDGYQTNRWQWTLHWPCYRHTFQDVHCYQMATPEDRALDIDGHLVKLSRVVAPRLRFLGLHRRCIVGEWSAALDPQSLSGLPQDDYKRYVEAQLRAFRYADAWFFWTYKTEASLPWSFRQLYEAGLIPVEPSKR
jgi:glucan 1,3-beta-glucosidase